MLSMSNFSFIIPEIYTISLQTFSILNMLPELSDKEIHYLKTVDQLKEIRSNVFIVELSEDILSQIEIFISQTVATNAHIIFICSSNVPVSIFRKVILFSNIDSVFLHFSTLDTILSSIYKASSQIFEHQLAQITQKEITNYNYITLKHKNKTLKILENLIQSVEKTSKNTIEVSLINNKNIESTSNLKDILNQSTPSLFQSHKSFLVNARYINIISPSEWNNYFITLENGDTIPLSKGFYPHFIVANDSLKHSKLAIK